MNREKIFYYVVIAFFSIQFIRGCYSCGKRNIIPAPDTNGMIAVSCSEAPDSTLDRWSEWKCVIDGSVSADWLTSEQQRQIYILRFFPTAQSEMQKYGIPASISLAQGILESRQGYSKLAMKHNNHFGIKCFSKKCKKGHCINFSDDHHKDFFKCYESAWHSWRDHSEFLMRKNYEECHECKDYKGWAKCLQKRGYATSKTYAKELIKLIEKYNLSQYDSVN